MRVVFLQDRLRVGGTERQMLCAGAGLRALGVDLQLVLFRPGGALADQPGAYGLPVQTLQRGDSGLSFWAPGLVTRLRALEPDAIVCWGRSANLYGARLQRALRDCAVIGSVRTGKPLWRKQRRALHRVDGVVVNSRWRAAQLSGWGIERERLAQVPNALLVEPLGPTAAAAARQLLRDQVQAPDGAWVCLHVSNLRRGKRVALLLEAFARMSRSTAPGLPPWQLWIVGEGGQQRALQRTRAARLLGQRLRWWGHQRDLERFYAAADVAVTASREDASSNALIEAQACGLPVLASDHPGLRDALAPGAMAELIDLRAGPTAWAEQLEARLRAPRPPAQTLQAAAASVRERHAPQGVARQLYAFLAARVQAKRACAGRGSAAR